MKATEKHQNEQSSTTYESVEELARELGLSRQSVYTGLRNGSIPCIRLGRRFILSRRAIQKWLEGTYPIAGDLK